MTYIKYDPFAVGFDRMIDRINQMHKSAKATTTYPPYNIRKTDENHYVVDIAVAGFNHDDLDVSMKDGVLVVRADANEPETGEDIWIHRGIAKRAFERTFTLADTIEVEDVFLDQGMLSIHLVNIIPEEQQPRKFMINTPKQLLQEG